MTEREREQVDAPRAHRPRRAGHLLTDEHESADALAAILGGYTNAAEQWPGTYPGAKEDADTTMEAIRHQDTALTRKLAREQFEADETERP